ncbi:hypothetical protein [Vogesella sp. XCS3]|uniref:hypothetical protein n=1 Tax=Vogesella sp. XCS3 TaxID=2877939 RepID=UPI001D09E04D|nr:hypothetical protein [Vogesella sp. XCS3]UDM16110.1 hypothetical protein LCH97_12525 [Vogesella sp. XCS3]
MSGAVIENGQSESNVIIEGRDGPASISMQLYQDLYNQITGKSEEIKQFSKKSIKVKLEDVRQFDIKIKQVLEQYKIVSFNSSFSIIYDKNQKETHSSIEKFMSLNNAISNCTESVFIKYNFAIILPQTSRAQSYTIAVKLSNRITSQKKLVEELPNGIPAAVVNMFTSKTCEITISYVDYVVARTVISVFDEWVDSLDESKESGLLNFARKNSHFIPSIFKYTTLLISVFVLANLMPTLVSNSPNGPQFFQFGVYLFVFIFILYKLAAAIGRFVERSIDASSEISYLDITNGDKKLINEVEASNKMAIVKTVFGSMAMALLNFAAKFIALSIKI